MMNVLVDYTTALTMQTVPMCLETLSVPVMMNILEMESHVLVGK